MPDERLSRLADELIPGHDVLPSASEADPAGKWLDRALAARPDLVPAYERALAAPSAKEAHKASVAVETIVIDWSQWGWHLLGTCRMGDDPAISVVDRCGRSHDVPNLFVVDGSVFVTSGRSRRPPRSRRTPRAAAPT